MQEQNDTEELNKAIDLYMIGIISISDAAEFCDTTTDEMVKILIEKGIYVKGLSDRFFKKERSNYQSDTSRKKDIEIEFDDDLFADVDEPLDIIADLHRDETKQKQDKDKEDKEEKQNTQSLHKSTERNPNSESTLFKLRELLHKNGPLHISEILKRLGIDPLKGPSLLGTLSKYTTAKKIFVRTAPSCFGLLSDNLIPYKRLKKDKGELTPGTVMARVVEILKEHGELHLDEIVKYAKVEGLGRKKGIRSSLDNHSKHGRIFVKIAPGIYSLIGSPPSNTL